MSFGTALLCTALTALPLDAPVLASVEVPQSLTNARRLSDQLRFEEAVVEYQRYLTDPNRPVAERARALLELGFLHLVLGDELSAKKRTLEALELDPEIQAGPSSPPKQVGFLNDVRRQFESRPKLEVLPRSGDEPAHQVRVRLQDPQRRSKRLLLRHALSPTGPYYGLLLQCVEERAQPGPKRVPTSTCVGEIPPPTGVGSYNAWYYAEALDSEGNTLAQAASPATPLQLSVVSRSPWYKSPWVWAGGAALVVGVAAVIFVTTGTSASR